MLAARLLWPPQLVTRLISFADIAAALQEVWPWGEMASVCEVASRLSHQFPVDLVEAAIWKVVAERCACSQVNRREGELP